MCIDGTYKFDEEKEDVDFPLPRMMDYEELLKKVFPEITLVNDKLIAMDIPCLIISVRKNKLGHVAGLHNELCALKDMEGIKMILYVEHTVNAKDLPVALWRFCNNVDPKRDSFIANRETIPCMGFDGTIKSKEFDNFKRDWPNIIVADDETINAIDKKWNELGIGEFIPSPSLKYRDQMYGHEAVVSI